MEWLDGVPEHGLGNCELLSGISTIGYIPDASKSFYYACPPGMTYNEVMKKCYSYGSGKVWQDAFDFCPTIHPEAHLVDILSQEEQDVVAEIAVATRKDLVYTSGKRIPPVDEDNFEWMNSGQPVVFAKWDAGEPFRTSSTSDCISMYKGTGWLWHDAFCTYASRGYICEY